MGFFARFLPNLIPGLGALANPWVLLALLGALVGAFLWGLHIGNERLETYQLAVKAVGEAQEEKTKRDIVERKGITQQTENDYAQWVLDLKRRNGELAGRLRDNSGRSLLPPVPETAGSGDPNRTIVCFDRGKFDAAMGAYRRSEIDETAAILARGDSARAVRDLCTAWSVKQWQLGTGK